MKKVILKIIGPVFIALGFLGSSAAISDDEKVDDLLIAQGNGEQMACWGKLHLCFDKSSETLLLNNKLPSPSSNNGFFDDFTCEAICQDDIRSEAHCTDEVCEERCHTAYATNESSGVCDAPTESASIMDLLKKSPVVKLQPQDAEAEAEAVDST